MVLLVGGSLEKSYEIKGIWLVLGRLNKEKTYYLFMGLSLRPVLGGLIGTQ
jgi:hypothetical protein